MRHDPHEPKHEAPAGLIDDCERKIRDHIIDRLLETAAPEPVAIRLGREGGQAATDHLSRR
jgi:hypothetical protein